MTNFDMAGFKFGLEQEFFIKRVDVDEDDPNAFTIVPRGMPHDNAGYLAEARGEPSGDVTEAVFSLRAAIDRLEKLAKSYKVSLFSDDAWLLLPIRVQIEALKVYGLPPKMKHVDNLYGLTLNDQQMVRQHAGIHLTVSRIVSCGNHRHTQMFDFVPMIKWLDHHFHEEIDMAGRLKGSYAVKNVVHGIGVEYRSLPTTLYHDHLLNGLLEMKKEGVLKYA